MPSDQLRTSAVHSLIVPVDSTKKRERCFVGNSARYLCSRGNCHSANPASWALFRCRTARSYASGQSVVPVPHGCTRRCPRHPPPGLFGRYGICRDPSYAQKKIERHFQHRKRHYVCPNGLRSEQKTVKTIVVFFQKKISFTE